MTVKRSQIESYFLRFGPVNNSVTIRRANLSEAFVEILDTYFHYRSKNFAKNIFKIVISREDPLSSYQNIPYLVSKHNFFKTLELCRQFLLYV